MLWRDKRVIGKRALVAMAAVFALLVGMVHVPRAQASQVEASFELALHASICGTSMVDAGGGSLPAPADDCHGYGVLCCPGACAAIVVPVMAGLASPVRYFNVADPVAGRADRADAAMLRAWHQQRGPPRAF